MKKKTTHLQRKENENNRKPRPTIHSRTKDIIKFTPPRKIAPSNQELEDERNDEEGRIIDPRRGRDQRYPVEQHGDADELVPAVRPPLLHQPEGDREDRADDDRV